MAMLPDICPGCKSVVGLSNVSNGTPDKLRPYLNRAYLAMLLNHGLYAAIVDAYDDEITAMAKGEMPEIIELVGQVMKDNEPDMSKLSEKEVQYVKTVKVLMGKTLYSDSWLEV